MTNSIAVDGYGVLFGVSNNASSPVYTDVAEILSIGGPTYSKDVIDVTHASSPDRYREFIAGLLDAGEVSLELQYTQADFAQFLALLESTFANGYRITIPDSNYVTKPTIVFNGHITSQESPIAIEDKISLSITIKVSGKPVYTQGT